MTFKTVAPFLIAGGAAVPGLALRLLGVPLEAPAAALVSGVAIIGASFLLLWACDAAQADISQALALAVVALLAVLPEYAVDMYFTWQAGRQPDAPYAQFAVANMTGANRLLIGVAWVAIAAIFYYRHGTAVRLERQRRTELLFLGLATAYAFLIPLKGSLAWYDGVVFVALYLWYITVASRRPCEGVEVKGAAHALLELPKMTRRLATAGLFAFAGAAILANAKPFCEGLISSGKLLHINEFVLVQWLAPIASEAPEFVVALVFAWRGQGGLALGSLVSAKLNQWTLLVGMIPAVFAFSHGTLQHPIPMNGVQMHEILLTAAQSLLGVVVLASLRLTLPGALLLFLLFAGQLVAPTLARWAPGLLLHIPLDRVHSFFAVLYVVAAMAVFLQRPRRLAALWAGRSLVDEDRSESADECCAEEWPDELAPRTRECLSCRWRLSGIQSIQEEQEAELVQK